MANHPEPFHVEHARLLRLAERLVGHPEDAQDLAQETWVRALRNGRSPRAQSRPWVAGVARNLALHFFRARHRRLRHESLSVAPESDVDLSVPSDSLESDALLTRLRLAVYGLREPFRETVVLRYFEERSVQNIATELGVPINTVRSRLRRGLRLLRCEFERDEIEGMPALAWLVATAATGAGLPPRVPGAAERSSASSALRPGVFALAAAATLGFSLFGILSFLDTSSDDRDQSPERDFDAAHSSAEGVDSSPLLATGTRSVATASTSGSGAADSALGLRVVSMSGESPAGMQVTSSSWAELGATENGEHAAMPTLPLVPVGTVDDAARFALMDLDEDRPWLITAMGQTQITIWAPIVRPGVVPGPIVVGSRAAVWGTVVDDRNVPIEGVTVRQRYTHEFELPQSAAQSDGRLIALEERSDADGLFYFFDARVAPGAVVEFTHPEHESLRISTTRPPPPQANRFMLPRTNPTREGMDARVVDADGEPIPRAFVATDDSLTVAGLDGGFSLGLDPGETVSSWIVAPGLAPRRVEVVGESGRPIELATPAASLRGTVVDESGEPLPGFEVVLADPTVMVVLDHFAYTAEPIAAGLRRGERGVSELQEATTDRDGRFELRGLAPRPTSVWLVDPETGLIIETAPLDVERAHRLVVPANAWLPKVEGRVVDAGGRPVSNALVNAYAVGTRYDTEPTNLNLATPSRCPFVTTDADGRFTLERVPRECSDFLAYHPEFGTSLVKHTGDGPLEITLRPHVAFIFFVNRADIDAVEFHDEYGEALTTKYRLGVSESLLAHIPVEVNAMGEAWVPASAQSVVFFSGGEVVDERPVHPVVRELGIVTID